jgi:hypothetical protein
LTGFTDDEDTFEKIDALDENTEEKDEAILKT